MRLIRGPQVVVGIVVQGRRIAPAGHDEGDDGKDRRRLPLDERAGARRKLGVDVGDLGPHVVQGLHHVGAGREIDVHLRRPADRSSSGPRARPAPCPRPPRWAA